MAQKQIKRSWLQNIKTWSGRHKVLTFLTIVVVISLSYLTGTWAVMQVKIHFERERYKDASTLVARLGDSMSYFNPVSDISSRSCSYTDNGSVFARRFLSCQVDMSVNIRNPSKTVAGLASKRLKDVANSLELGVHANASGMGRYDVADYVFTYKGLSCGFTLTVYGSNIAADQRYAEASDEGNDLYVDISCSGPASTEYFPMSQS